MKIVMVDGALANQMTQYIFARCLEEHLKDTDEPVFLDDLWFHSTHTKLYHQTEHIENGQYQLNKFPNLKKITLMSEYFDPDVWQDIIEESKKKPVAPAGSHLPQILKDNGLDLFMIAETNLHRFDGKIAQMPFYHYMPEMLESQGNCYYFGWYTHGGWFMRHEEMFRKELAFPPLWEQRDIDMMDLIHDSIAISVHVRKGSYGVMGAMTPTDYFKNSLDVAYKKAKEMRRERRYSHKTPRIFVFSDELDWVREHAKEYGLDKTPYQVVWGAAERDRTDNQCDMQLMSECDIMILELRSVYSYMAALLNTKSDKFVINPNKGRGIF